MVRLALEFTGPFYLGSHPAHLVPLPVHDVTDGITRLSSNDKQGGKIYMFGFVVYLQGEYSSQNPPNINKTYFETMVLILGGLVVRQLPFSSF